MTRYITRIRAQGRPADIDPAALLASGYTSAEVATLTDAVTAAMAKPRGGRGGKGEGGGSGREGFEGGGSGCCEDGGRGFKESCCRGEGPK